MHESYLTFALIDLKLRICCLELMQYFLKTLVHKVPVESSRVEITKQIGRNCS